MKTDKQVVGVKGTLVVRSIINNFWKSDWEDVSPANDDAIDGIIHIRKNRELTGEVIYVQVKTGDGYKVETLNRPKQFGVNVGQKYIEDHKARWNAFRGAVILVFVDNNEKAYWTNLKSFDSFTDENKSIILLNKSQRFGAHSKGHFKKIGDVFLQDRQLTSVKMEKPDISYLRIDEPLKFTARKYYNRLGKIHPYFRTNPGLGEVIFNRCGWRHISRAKRGYDKIFQSWQLLSAALKIIQEVDKAFQITKQELISLDKSEYVLKDFISLRAKVIFPNRHESVIQVILRRKKTINKISNKIEQKVWFYSVYEPRRGIRI